MWPISQRTLAVKKPERFLALGEQNAAATLSNKGAWLSEVTDVCVRISAPTAERISVGAYSRRRRLMQVRLGGASPLFFLGSFYPAVVGLGCCRGSSGRAGAPP